MRNFLLLFLSLITGCQSMSDVEGCREGWVEFTCKCPKSNNKYKIIYVIGASHAQSTQKDVWEKKGRFFLYHDTKKKTLRVIIKQLKTKDSGEYRCEFDKSNSPSSMELQLLDDGSCQRSFIQTAYRTAKTTITCDYNPNKDDSREKFFCKEIGSVCEVILSTKSSKSNETFTLTETNRGFNVSISNVSSQHAGVYWCGAKSNEGSYRYAFRKIQLGVKDITTFERSPTAGQNFTYWCAYRNNSLLQNKKFICKGEDPSTCDPLLDTGQLNMKNRKFSMMEEKKKNITITIRNVTTEDTGTYWCGAESSDQGHSNPFFNRLMMTVIQPTVTTFPVSSTQSTTASAQSHGGAHVVIIVITCVSVLLLLLFGLILILIYKRHLKSRAAAQHIREEYIYEDIQEHFQKPDSETAVNTIYVTADFPTNPSASLHYSNINHQNCSDNGEARITSSSACEYSTVMYSQRPIYSTVNQPSSGDPLYSTVNQPQEE